MGNFVQGKDDYVLKLLEDAGLVTRSQIENAKARLNGSANAVDLLIKDGIVSDADVSRSLAAQAQMDWVDLSSKVIPPEVIKQIRAEDARRFKVIPVGYGESGLIVAVSDPLDIDTIDSLSFLLQREIELVCASPEKIRQALVKYYGTADEASDILVQQIGHDVDFGLEITEGGDIGGADEADAPIIRMVSMLLIEAHRLVRDFFSPDTLREVANSHWQVLPRRIRAMRQEAAARVAPTTALSGEACSDSPQKKPPMQET